MGDEIDLGPPVLVWRDDPLFNRGHVGAELALGALRELEAGDVWEESNAEHAIEQLEAFLSAASEEARKRAATPMHCTRCGKRLSRKSARLIDGKLLCSACVFPPMKPR